MTNTKMKVKEDLGRLKKMYGAILVYQLLHYRGLVKRGNISLLDLFGFSLYAYWIYLGFLCIIRLLLMLRRQ